MVIIRRDGRRLTNPERQKYRDTLVAARATDVYQEMVALHVHFAEQFHKGLPFLVWHRLYLIQFEYEMRRIDADFELPYWRWLRDRNKSYVFRNRYLGSKGAGGAVNGPFGSWNVVGAPALTVSGGGKPTKTMAAVPIPSSSLWNGPIKRHRGDVTRPKSTLGYSYQVKQVQKIKTYDVTDFTTKAGSTSYRNRLEGFAASKKPGDGIHNEVHNWTGGTRYVSGSKPKKLESVGVMRHPVLSPNDPIFWVHHAEIDRLWWLWQGRHKAAEWWPKNTDLAGVGNAYADYTRTTALPPWDGRTYAFAGGTTKTYPTITVEEVLDIDNLSSDLLGAGTGDVSYRYDRKSR